MAAIRHKKKPDLGYHTVSKLTVISRLASVDKFNDALAILKSNDENYEKWNSVLAIRSDDLIAQGLIQAVGLDPDVILAKE